VHEPHHSGNGHVADLNGREIVTLAPLAALCVLLGVYPKPFLDTARPELQTIAGFAKEARGRLTPKETTTTQAPTPIAGNPIPGD
jgi:NADH:ubiquinone oxidoreductase subunit 4 (subunit M)